MPAVHVLKFILSASGLTRDLLYLNKATLFTFKQGIILSGDIHLAVGIHKSFNPDYSPKKINNGLDEMLQKEQQKQKRFSIWKKKKNEMIMTHQI